MPLSSVECERCFSELNNIKTPNRNKLKEATIDCLMRIKRNGPVIENFDFKTVFELWKNYKKRYFIWKKYL